jgi:hypothetical protein
VVYEPILALKITGGGIAGSAFVFEVQLNFLGHLGIS